MRGCLIVCINSYDSLVLLCSRRAYRSKIFCHRLQSMLLDSLPASQLHINNTRVFYLNSYRGAGLPYFLIHTSITFPASCEWLHSTLSLTSILTLNQPSKNHYNYSKRQPNNNHVRNRPLHPILPPSRPLQQSHHLPTPVNPGSRHRTHVPKRPPPLPPLPRNA